ncbi:lipoyl(octanoyl) transferase LipB [Corynebacterium durum]|uniref:lipoyl(octanoyl) transferase LipB n=1 Tax=Corynebacterium durum TaxID=61592 RepID=UPI0015CDB248|nr:lipoyl(octanoyl) transferase LipB [Corynebacterium durum]NYI73865.1 lipoyl(octanoyl) transferase [Corynebacterium durum]WJY85587.1 Octanoyltransferase [Corynebacterium durum]
MTAPRAPFTAPDQPIRDISTPLEVYNLGTVDYVEMWDRQAELAAQRADGLINDQLLFLEHPNTYTAGKRTQPEDRPTNGLPVVDVDRGGRITWHGPGQLVCYPIIKLAEPVDVVDYVRRVEEAIIQVVRDLGLQDAGRVDGRSGVWIPGNDTRPERKVGALGIRVTRGVTMHGLALNCNNTLEFYQHIVPCGIADAGVTTLSAELGRDVDTQEMVAPLAAALGAAFSGELTVADHSFTRREQP